MRDIGDGSPSEIDHVARQRLHRRAVGVVGGARVQVRLPVPAEADRLDAHQMTGGHARVPQSGRRQRPVPELIDEAPLLVGGEPATNVHDVGQRSRDVVPFLGDHPSDRTRAARSMRRLGAERSGRRQGDWSAFGFWLRVLW